MRFLHIADVHLDTGFAGRSDEVRARLREASRTAFVRAVDLAIREDVHAILIAGDLFDGDRLSFETERFLLRETERLQDHQITVVYATGNHDPGGNTGGPRTLPWPACVRVADDRTPRRFQILDRQRDPVGFVTAVGHDGPRVSEDLSRLLPAPGDELPEVALLHTQVHSSEAAEQHHAYAPSDLTWLRHAGYDYWALGHIHVGQELSDDPPIWYSGSLQGKTHGDRGARGGLLVDLSDRRNPAVSFRSLAPVRWDTIEASHLDHVDSLDELERAIRVAWQAVRDADPAPHDIEWMVRVVLSGPCPLWSELRTEEDRATLGRELRGVLGALDVLVVADTVHPVIPLDEHRLRTDVLGEVLRLSDAVRGGRVSLHGVLEGGLAGVTGDDPAAIDAYVRDLLGGADGELAARLLEGES